MRSKILVLLGISILITITLPPVLVEGHSPISPYGVEFEPHEHGLSRDEVVQAIWPEANPIDDPASYPVNIVETGSDTRRIEFEPDFSSRLRFWEPVGFDRRCFVIYHEGHAPNHARTPEGLATKDWFIARGCKVFYLDMPLRGINAKDQRPGLLDHEGFETWPWDRSYHPLSLYLEPISHVVNMIYQQTQYEPQIIMIGRSGGGWTTAWYTAIDPRIDRAIVAMGLVPQSIRLRPTLDGGLVKIGDYEQSVSEIYDQISYEDLINLIGPRLMFVYNGLDPCCFDLMPDDPYVAWLAERAEVSVNPTWDQHSISPAGYEAMAAWLEPKRVWLPLVMR